MASLKQLPKKQQQTRHSAYILRQKNTVAKLVERVTRESDKKLAYRRCTLW